MQSFVMGSGCFWCLDAALRGLRGVEGSVCGYSGGDTPHPDYRSVCSGATGHQEVVKVEFDEAVIPPETIVDVFFSVHDPTSWDRQGADNGSQYRSVLFYENEDQREFFEAAKARAQKLWDQDIVTVIAPLEKFWEAEDYHQNYYALNPGQGYCIAVINPKLSKVRQQYAEYLQ